jgi:hypothetical protein
VGLALMPHTRAENVRAEQAAVLVQFDVYQMAG